MATRVVLPLQVGRRWGQVSPVPADDSVELENIGHASAAELPIDTSTQATHKVSNGYSATEQIDS